MKLEEFQSLVLDDMPEPADFKPFTYFNREGDCIEFYLTRESYIGHRVDSLLTVHHGRRTNEIVGCQIKGVSKFIERILEKAPGFKIEVEDRKVKLESLFTAKLWAGTEDPSGTVVVTYQRLRDAAKKAEAVAELDLAIA